VLLSLAFGVAALAVAGWTLVFAAFASAALFIPSLSMVDRVGVVADAKRFRAVAGRIR
jgi:hypothetical protein